MATITKDKIASLMAGKGKGLKKQAKAAAKAVEERQSEFTGGSSESAPSAEIEKVSQKGALASSSAMPDTSAVKTSRDRAAVLVDVRTLKQSFQIRKLVEENPDAYSPEKIQALAALIKSTNGGKIRQSLDLHKVDDSDDLELVEGMKRVMACTWLAESENDEDYYYQPGRISQYDDSEDIELLQFLLNNSKEEVDLKTTAALFHKKLAEGMTQAELSKATSYSTSKISRIVKIETYPEEIQAMIWAGELPYTGRTLDKALKEFKAELKALAAQPEESPSVASESLSDIKHEGADYQAGPVESIDPQSLGTVAESESAEAFEAPSVPVPSESPKDTAVAEAPKKAEKPKPKKPAVKKSKPISIEQEQLNKLYQIVCMTEAVRGLSEDLVFDEKPSRADLLKKVNDVDELLSDLKAAHDALVNSEEAE